MTFSTLELTLYAIAGGAVLGLVLGLTRAHMTGRATFLFSMLYYFLFTGFVNIRRWMIDGDPFDDNAAQGFYRALVFAVSATVVIILFRVYRRRKLDAYILDLEDKVGDQTPQCSGTCGVHCPHRI